MIDNRQHIIGKEIPYDFEVITVAATAIGLTATKLKTASPPKKVIITVETAQSRYRIDGTDPTSTIGHLLNVNSSLILSGYAQLNNFKAIKTGVTSAKFVVTYLR